MNMTDIIRWSALALIIVALLTYYHFKIPKGSDKSAAKEFIKGYTRIFESIIRRIITEIDITKFRDIEEFQTTIYSLAYDECWKYIEKCVKEASDNCNLKTLVRKCITREFVESFIDDAMSMLIANKCSDVYITRVQNVIAQAEEEDKKLQKEADEYEMETKVVEPYIETEEKIDLSTLRPPREDEEEYAPDDDSQEIVDESVPSDKERRERHTVVEIPDSDIMIE